MTEITDNIAREARGVVFFDAACGACSSGAIRMQRLLGRRGILFLPLQTPQAVELTHLTPEELRREMKLRLADGRVLGGADAVLHLAQMNPWSRPFAWLGATRFMRPMLRSAYTRFARNRYRLSAACKLPNRRRDYLGWFPWIIGVALIASACASRAYVAPWVTMWALAVAIFSTLKTLTWWPYRFSATTGRSVAYLFGCATLDAERFLTRSHSASSDPRDVLRAVVHALIGVAMFWGVARLLPPRHPALVAWTGMIGLVLMLHFGLLQLLSIAWQRAGIDAPLVMNRPLAFVSLADFWSRWNRPFTTLAFETIFRPLRRFSVAGATLATFFVSGLVHDLAISFPAGAGYGRPTVYFLIQAAGILLERKLRLPRIVRRLFAVVVLIAPVALLFHAPFIDRVILPMMSDLHALGKELP